MWIDFNRSNVVVWDSFVKAWFGLKNDCKRTDNHLKLFSSFVSHLKEVYSEVKR